MVGKMSFESEMYLAVRRLYITLAKVTNPPRPNLTFDAVVSLDTFLLRLLAR